MAKSNLPLRAVYCIRFVGTTLVYVGSSKNIPNRWNSHKVSLKRGRHSNKSVQKAWNDFNGAVNAVFEILEIVPEDGSLLDREQHWMDILCVDGNSLNHHLNSRGPTGFVRSDEQKEKLRAHFKGKPNPGVSAYRKGRKFGPRPPEHMAAAFTALQAWHEQRRAEREASGYVPPGTGRPELIGKTANKLVESQVVEIAEMIRSGIRSTVIAERFGISTVMVGCIRRGKAWASVTGGKLTTAYYIPPLESPKS